MAVIETARDWPARNGYPAQACVISDTNGKLVPRHRLAMSMQAPNKIIRLGQVDRNNAQAHGSTPGSDSFTGCPVCLSFTSSEALLYIERNQRPSGEFQFGSLSRLHGATP